MKYVYWCLFAVALFLFLFLIFFYINKMNQAEETYEKMQRPYYEMLKNNDIRSEENCVNKGGVIVRSHWDRRIIDCKRSELTNAFHKNRAKKHVGIAIN